MKYSLKDCFLSVKMPVFIIAELSANHNGSLQTAIDTIIAAKRAGADAIKLQTYTPDTITINSQKSDFKLGGDSIWEGRYLYDLYQEAYTPWEWHKILFDTARSVGLEVFSTPFDFTSVDFLESLNPPAYKIASFEITDIPLIEYVASKGRPVIISTGIATHDDIKLAIEACYRMGNKEVALLKCTSSYPAPIEEANMIMLQEMAKNYNVTVGLSDHTIGFVVPLVATCFGAKIIEKHFILNHSVGGPDSSFSMDEIEFTEMVNLIRCAEKSIGIISHELTEKQKKGRDFCRSLYVIDHIKAGELINEQNIRSIRPGYGLHPKYYSYVIGKRAKFDLEPGTRLSLTDITDNE